MRDAVRVGRCEPARDLTGIFDRLACWQCAVGQHVAQRLTAEQFHHGVRRAAIDAEIEDAQDVRMREGCDRLRFALETCERHRIGSQRLRHDLDGDVAIQFRVAGAVNLAHPTSTDGAQNLVATDASPASQRHRRNRIAEFPEAGKANPNSPR